MSVCIPAYKAERFIAATIESVLAQTTEDWELVVVDDASPDGTYDVAARYAGDRRVRVERNATNLGPVGNWNHVVAQARGRYVKLLCSDDLLYPTCLARQAERPRRPSRAPAWWRPAATSSTPTAGSCSPVGAWPACAARSRAGGRWSAWWRSARRRSGSRRSCCSGPTRLREAGPFRGDYATLIDVDRYAEVLRRWDCVAVDETLAAFRVSGGSWSDRSHRVQGRNLRRLLDDLAADPALALPRSAVWRGRLWSYVRAPAAGLVFRAAEWRARAPR